MPGGPAKRVVRMMFAPATQAREEWGAVQALIDMRCDEDANLDLARSVGRAGDMSPREGPEESKGLMRILLLEMLLAVEVEVRWRLAPAPWSPTR